MARRHFRFGNAGTLNEMALRSAEVERESPPLRLRSRWSPSTAPDHQEWVLARRCQGTMPRPKAFPFPPGAVSSKMVPLHHPRPPGVGVGKAVRGTESLPTNLATLACSCWGRGWWRPLHLTPRCRLRSLRSLRPTLHSVTVFAGKARQTPRQPLRGRQGSATRGR